MCVRDNLKFGVHELTCFHLSILVIARYKIFVDTEFIGSDPSGFLSLYLLSGTFGHLGANGLVSVDTQDVHAKPYSGLIWWG